MQDYNRIVWKKINGYCLLKKVYTFIYLQMLLEVMGLTVDIYNLLWDIVLITYTSSLELFLFHNVIVIR